MKRHFCFSLIVVLGCCLTNSVSAQSEPKSSAQTLSSARSITPPKTETSDETSGQANSALPGRSIGTTIAALGAILLLFLGVVQVWRRYSPTVSMSLPESAWEVLGSAPIDQKYQLTIVRVGSRLIVLGKSDQALQTLSGITNGEEVAELMTMCQTNSSPSETVSFGDLINKFKSRTDQVSITPIEETKRA